MADELVTPVCHEVVLKPGEIVEGLRAKLANQRADWQSLLRLPFEVEVQTRPADRHGPAEYDFVFANEADVQAAVDWLIDKHITELEAKVSELMQARAEGSD